MNKTAVVAIILSLISIGLGTVALLGVPQSGETKFPAKFHLTRNGENWSNITLGIFEQQDDGWITLMGVFSTDNSGTALTQYYLSASYTHSVNMFGSSPYEVMPLPHIFYLNYNYSNNESPETLFDVSTMITIYINKTNVLVERQIEPNWFHTVKYIFSIDLLDNSPYITRMLAKTLD